MKLQTAYYLPESDCAMPDPTIGLRDLRKGLNTILLGYLLSIGACLMIGAIIAAESGAAFRRIIEDGRVFTLQDPDGRRGGYSSLVVYAVDYVDALRERRKLRESFAALFRRHDVIVAPGESSVAFPIGVPFDKAYPGVRGDALTTAANLVGAPAIALPNGFGLHGLPTSIMFVGPPFAENSLITLAALLQAKSGWHRNHPPIAATG